MRRSSRETVPCVSCGAKIYWLPNMPRAYDEHVIEGRCFEPPPAAAQCPKCGHAVDTTTVYPYIAGFPMSFEVLRRSYEGFAPRFEGHRRLEVQGWVQFPEPFLKWLGCGAFNSANRPKLRSAGLQTCVRYSSQAWRPALQLGRRRTAALRALKCRLGGLRYVAQVSRPACDIPRRPGGPRYLSLAWFEFRQAELAAQLHQRRQIDGAHNVRHHQAPRIGRDHRGP